MGFRPTPNIGPDFGRAITDAANVVQLQQQQEEIKRQNALRGILGRPGALDAMGQPTVDTMQGVMSVDPNAGMKLQQNALITRQHAMQQDVVKSKLFGQKLDMLTDAYGPIGQRHAELVKGGMSAGQADAAVQPELDAANQRFETAGIYTPEELARHPKKYNAGQFSQFMDASTLVRDRRKELLNEDRLRQQQKKDDETNQRTGTVTGTDNEGNPLIIRPNAAPGQPKATYLDGSPVPEDKLRGTRRMGTGPNTTSSQDRAAIDNVVRTDLQKELGRPLTPEDKPEVDRRVLAEEDRRKAAHAAAPTQDRAATERVVKDAFEKELGRPMTPADQAEFDRRVLAAQDRRKAETAGATAGARERAKQGENLGVPEDPEEAASKAAQVATGQPLTQVIPGYGQSAVKAREQARKDAVQLLRDQNPGMTAAEAGVELANRGIEYATGKKAAGILGSTLATSRQAVKQLDFNVDKVTQEMKKLASSDISPVVNAIARGVEKWTGDPAYSSLFFFMQAAAMESARILSGGTASIQQLHEGARKEAEKWANVNMTPASWGAVSKAMREEGHFRLQSYEEALKESRVGHEPAAPGAASPAASGSAATPEQLRTLPKPATPAEALALPPGSQYIGPGGVVGIVPQRPGAPAPASTAPARTPPAAAKPNPTELPDGTIVSQGGKRYRKEGSRWIAVE